MEGEGKGMDGPPIFPNVVAPMSVDSSCYRENH